MRRSCRRVHISTSYLTGLLPKGPIGKESIVDLLPKELLDIISGLIGKADQAALLRTCKDLFDVVCRRMYDDVVVGDTNARRFFLLVADENVTQVYNCLVKSLKYHGNSLADVYLTFGLILPALARLPNLMYIDFKIPDGQATFFHQHVRRSLIGHPVPAYNEFTLEALPLKEAFHTQPTVYNLVPSLRTLVFNARPTAIDIFRNCPVTELQLLRPASDKDLRYVLQSLNTCANGNETLTSLGLALSARTSDATVKNVQYLAEVCRNLKELVIYAPCVNALQISHFFSTHPNTLSNLVKFAVNEQAGQAAQYFSGQLQCLDQQRAHVQLCVASRSSLQEIAFGPIVWKKWEAGKNTWSMKDLMAHQSSFPKAAFPTMVVPHTLQGSLKVRAYEIYYLLGNDNRDVVLEI